MSDVEAKLRAQLKEKDQRILALEIENEEYQQKHHELQTQFKSLEANYNRVKTNVANLEAKAKRAQEAEKAALKKLKEMGGGAANASSASLIHSNSMAVTSTPKPVPETLAHAETATFGEIRRVDSVVEPTVSSSTQPAVHSTTLSSRSSSVGADATIAKLQRELNDLRANHETAAQQSKAWKMTAQCVVESYKQRIADVEEQEQEFLDLVLLQRRCVVEALVYYKTVAEGASPPQVSPASSRQPSPVTGFGSAPRDRFQQQQQQQQGLNVSSNRSGISGPIISEEDEIRIRREISGLREQLLLNDREKLVLERELKTLDANVVELEANLRSSKRENRELEGANEDLKRQISTLASKMVDMSSLKEMASDGGKGAIVSHSELRAEVAVLQDRLAESNREKEALREKMKKMKAQFREMEEQMKTLYQDGIRAREAMLAEISSQRANTDELLHAETDRVKVDSERQQWKYVQRIAELEALLSHKDSALAVLEQRNERIERSAGGGGASGQRRADVSPSRASTSLGGGSRSNSSAIGARNATPTRQQPLNYGQGLRRNNSAAETKPSAWR